MERLISKLRTLIAYLRSYGLTTGAKLAVEVLATGKGTLELGGERVSVRIRRGTSDRRAFNQVFAYHECDHPCLPSDASLVVDAGANVGYTSLFFAAKYPRATVLAIEPERSNFEALVGNVRHNARISPRRAALWPTHGTLDIANQHADAWAFQVCESPRGEIPAVTVLDILDEQKTNIDLLKLDIEGAERELFQTGADGWLDKVGTIVIETHDDFRPGCRAALLDALSGRACESHNVGEKAFFVLR